MLTKLTLGAQRAQQEPFLRCSGLQRHEHLRGDVPVRHHRHSVASELLQLVHGHDHLVPFHADVQPDLSNIFSGKQSKKF
jgi:hypothetical protein